MINTVHKIQVKIRPTVQFSKQAEAFLCIPLVSVIMWRLYTITSVLHIFVSFLELEISK